MDEVVVEEADRTVDMLEELDVVDNEIMVDVE